MVVNGEISVSLNLKLIEIILHLYKNEKIPKEKFDEIIRIKDVLSNLVKERSFANKKDLDFYKQLDEFYK